MSIFRHSTVAIRRVACKDNRAGKRPYSQMTQPVMRISQEHTGSQSRTQGRSDGWIVPAAIAFLGLGFSTFSTHQMMTASSNVNALPSQK